MASIEVGNLSSFDGSTLATHMTRSLPVYEKNKSKIKKFPLITWYI